MKDIVNGFTIRVAAAITLFAIVLYALFEYRAGMKYHQPPIAELVTLEYYQSPSDTVLFTD
jgi:hypothetical protein